MNSKIVPAAKNNVSSEYDDLPARTLIKFQYNVPGHFVVGMKIESANQHIDGGFVIVHATSDDALGGFWERWMCQEAMGTWSIFNEPVRLMN